MFFCAVHASVMLLQAHFSLTYNIPLFVQMEMNSTWLETIAMPPKSLSQPTSQPAWPWFIKIWLKCMTRVLNWWINLGCLIAIGTFATPFIKEENAHILFPPCSRHGLWYYSCWKYFVFKSPFSKKKNHFSHEVNDDETKDTSFPSLAANLKVNEGNLKGHNSSRYAE